jgi:glutathione peroxidase-family protein
MVVEAPLESWKWEGFRKIYNAHTKKSLVSLISPHQQPFKHHYMGNIEDIPKISSESDSLTFKVLLMT